MLKKVLAGASVIAISMLPSSSPAEIMPLRGTLVVMAPSKDGLVVAADSRSTVAGKFCDDQRKIIVPSRPDRTVATVTGRGTFTSFPAIMPPDLCTYMKQVARELDIESLVHNYLEDHNTPIRSLDIAALSQKCVDALQRFGEKHPTSVIPFAGREVFSVVLASYDPGSRASTIRQFAVGWNSPGRAVAGQISVNDLEIDAKFGPLAFGETAYLNQIVYRGVGRAFLSKSTIDTIMAAPPISKVDQKTAVDIAVNIVEATSKATEIVSAPSGIGGPVDVLFLGSAPHPEQVQWKPK